MKDSKQVVLSSNLLGGNLCICVSLVFCKNRGSTTHSYSHDTHIDLQGIKKSGIQPMVHLFPINVLLASCHLVIAKIRIKSYNASNRSNSFKMSYVARIVVFVISADELECLIVLLQESFLNWEPMKNS